jgi:choline dehydrogenase
MRRGPGSSRARAASSARSAQSIFGLGVCRRSGIGPAEHLRDLGIDPVADLPGTGANLHDHPAAMASYAPAVALPRSRYNHGESYSALSTPLAGAWPDLHVFPILLPAAPPGLQAPAGGFALVRGSAQACLLPVGPSKDGWMRQWPPILPGYKSILDKDPR